MKYFIFRNNTVESLFGNSDIGYSGYDDVSYVASDADSYIWFYQVPIKFDTVSLMGEVNEYIDKFQIIFSQIPTHKQILVFSLESLFDLHFCSSELELVNTIDGFNRKIRELAAQHQNIKIIDFSEFLRQYSNDQLIDWKYYFISQMVLNPKLARDFRKWFAARVSEMTLKRKKCLVLDLDNTLWHGVIGEDGINGIGIGGDYPGKAFLYFQEALIELSRKGIILTVCSKNNESDVLEVWDKNPFIKLNQKYISAYRINWRNKAENIKELAEELNIGLDSFVFVDDNPTERELVKQMLPMVEVPDFPEHPYQLIPFFSLLVDRYFRIYEITEEDKRKTEQYKANKFRKQEQQRFSDLSMYLESLQIEMEVVEGNDFNLVRIAQMTQKTNQFNLTTRRYTDQDIRAMIDKGWLVYCINVKDKFGDNGITGAIFLEPTSCGIVIDSFLLSCRVLGKGIEFAFIQAIVNRLYESGVNRVIAYYFPTLKNAQVADFYNKLGFELVDENKDGIKRYELNVTDPFKIAAYYNIIFK